MNKLFVFLFTLSVISGFSQTNKYVWEPYGLSCNSSLNLTETQDAEYWELEDDPFNFWLDAERIPVTDYESNWINSDAKITAFKVAESGGYPNINDGGAIPNVPSGYFVTSFDEGITTYIIIIIDLKSKMVFEIYLDDELERKPLIFEIINSFQFK